MGSSIKLETYNSNHSSIMNNDSCDDKSGKLNSRSFSKSSKIKTGLEKLERGIERCLSAPYEKYINLHLEKDDKNRLDNTKPLNLGYKLAKFIGIQGKGHELATRDYENNLAGRILMGHIGSRAAKLGELFIHAITGLGTVLAGTTVAVLNHLVFKLQWHKANEFAARALGETRFISDLARDFVELADPRKDGTNLRSKKSKSPKNDAKVEEQTRTESTFIKTADLNSSFKGFDELESSAVEFEHAEGKGSIADDTVNDTDFSFSSSDAENEDLDSNFDLDFESSADELEDFETYNSETSSESEMSASTREIDEIEVSSSLDSRASEGISEENESIDQIVIDLDEDDYKELADLYNKHLLFCASKNKTPINLIEFKQKYEMYKTQIGDFENLDEYDKKDLLYAFDLMDKETILNECPRKTIIGNSRQTSKKQATGKKNKIVGSIKKPHFSSPSFPSFR